MAEQARPGTVPKKFYRHFFKALGYYTERLNRACTLRELQAYVYLKSNCALTEKQLVPMSQSVMKDLVASGIALYNGGFYRLNEHLRFSVNSSSIRRNVQPSIPFHSYDESGPSSSNRGIHFSNIVTMWPMDREVETAATLDARLPPGLLDTPQIPTEEIPEEGGLTNEASEDEAPVDEEDNTKSIDTDPQAEQKKDTVDQSDSSEPYQEDDAVETLRVSTSSSDSEKEETPIPHKPIKQEPTSGNDADEETQQSSS